MKTIEHWIGASLTSGASTRRGKVWNPATGEQQAEVALAERSGVDAAVREARQAFESWQNVSLVGRARDDIYRDESFGPVVVVLRANSFDEAIELINSNPYGNGTAIFTSSGNAARKFLREVNVGMIGINVPVPVPMAFYSAAGRSRCSATRTSTGRRASGSTPAPRRSPTAGRTWTTRSTTGPTCTSPPPCNPSDHPSTSPLGAHRAHRSPP